MNSSLKQFSDIIATATDNFSAQHTSLDILMGIMDKTLRNQGMNADAITLDCHALDKKIVIVLHDEKPDIVDLALGNKNGDIYSSLQHKRADFNVEIMLEVMSDYFAK